MANVMLFQLTQERLSWDDAWMYCAQVIGRRSKCSLAQVGAVVVTSDNRVNSTGYNGPPRGMPAEGPCTDWCPRAMMPPEERARNYTDCPGIHAEANALLRSDWSQAQGGTIYSSAAVCLNCARLIANSGLARVVHCVVTEADRGRHPDMVESFLRDAKMDVIRWKAVQ